MNIPTHFYLKRRKWMVELVEEPIYDGGDWCRGICDFDERTIYIWAGLGHVKMLRTFVHEMMHAIEYEMGLKIRHRLIYDLEEPLAYLILLLFSCQPVYSKRWQPGRRLGRRRHRRARRI